MSTLIQVRSCRLQTFKRTRRLEVYFMSVLISIQLAGGIAPLHPGIRCLASHDAPISLEGLLYDLILSEKQLSRPPNGLAEVPNQLFSLPKIR